MSASNEEFQPTGISNHENGGNEFAANAPGNNVASSIGSSNSLREEAVATHTTLNDDQRGKGKRIKYLSTKLRGFVNNTIQKSFHLSLLRHLIRLTSGIFYLIANFVNCDKFSMRN